MNKKPYLFSLIILSFSFPAKGDIHFLCSEDYFSPNDKCLLSISDNFTSMHPILECDFKYPFPIPKFESIPCKKDTDYGYHNCFNLDKTIGMVIFNFGNGAQASLSLEGYEDKHILSRHMKCHFFIKN